MQIIVVAEKPTFGLINLMNVVRDIWQIPFWWDRFLEDPAFVLQLKTRWLQLRGNQLSNTAILEKIDTYLETLMASNSIEENFEKWPVLGQYIWPNNFVGNTYTEDNPSLPYKYYLVNWINDRLSWLDSEISGL